MKYSFVVIFILMGHASVSQKACDGISIGQFFSKLKDLKPVDQKALLYKEVKYFDFAKFLPTDSAADIESPIIGYDSKGNICEIIFEDHDHEYSLLVYNFKDFRILILKSSWNKGDFYYTPTAIYSSRKGN